jgi:hypothetical protein
LKQRKKVLKKERAVQIKQFHPVTEYVYNYFQVFKNKFIKQNLKNQTGTIEQIDEHFETNFTTFCSLYYS